MGGADGGQVSLIASRARENSRQDEHEKGPSALSPDVSLPVTHHHTHLQHQPPSAHNHVETETGERTPACFTPSLQAAQITRVHQLAGVHRGETESAVNVRVHQLESELRCLRGLLHNQIESVPRNEILELDIVKEFRVRTKKAVITALLRTQKHITARDDGPEYDGVLQTGTISWCYPCSMERFKAFTTYIFNHFRDSETSERMNAQHSYCKQRSVIFTPSHNTICSTTGFSEAEITFANAMEFFRCIGIQRNDDIMRLLWVPFGAGDKFVRVVGSV